MKRLDGVEEYPGPSVSTDAQIEQYIREHKELKHLISVFMSKILQDKPEDTVAYAVKYFTKPDLEETIEKETRNPTTFDS